MTTEEEEAAAAVGDFMKTEGRSSSEGTSPVLARHSLAVDTSETKWTSLGKSELLVPRMDVCAPAARKPCKDDDDSPLTPTESLTSMLAYAGSP